MRLRIWHVVAAVIAAVAVVGGAIAAQRADRADPAPALAAGTATVTVTTGTLTDSASLDGQLDFGPQTPIAMRSSGTVTWLPPAGTIVSRGDTLLRVDDRPVVLLYGDLPMYRDLTEAASPAPATTGADSTTPAAPVPALHGRDVLQFESNLEALGYSGYSVDETYSAKTAEAVRRWQAALGMATTGTVAVGDVFYAPGPVRIDHTLSRIGAPATGDLLSYTATDRVVTVQAPASDTAWATAGAAVTVTLPDGRALPGVVRAVDTAATPPGGAAGNGDSTPGSPPATVAVTIAIEHQEELGTLQRSPVTVTHVIAERKGVLIVPVAALVALAEGGYGLEVVEPGSEAPGRFVAVRTGLFANGQVEVSGPEIRDGMAVRVPQ